MDQDRHPNSTFRAYPFNPEEGMAWRNQDDIARPWIVSCAQKETDAWSMRSRVEADTLHVVTQGDIDLYTAPYFKSVLVSRFDSHLEVSNLSIDLRETSFIDSTTLGVIAGAYKKVRARGEGTVKIVTNDRKMSKIFEITGLDRLFEIEHLPLPEPTTGE